MSDEGNWYDNVFSLTGNGFNNELKTKVNPNTGETVSYNPGLVGYEPEFDAVDAASSGKKAGAGSTAKDKALSLASGSSNPLISGAATGASIGGPWGAAAGAALGAVQSAKRKQEMQRAEYNSNLDSIAAALSTWG